MSVAQLVALDRAAWAEGDAEGRVGGLGVVVITRIDRRRHYYLNGSPVAGASLYRAVRALEQGIIVEIPPKKS